MVRARRIPQTPCPPPAVIPAKAGMTNGVMGRGQTERHFSCSQPVFVRMPATPWNHDRSHEPCGKTVEDLCILLKLMHRFLLFFDIFLLMRHWMRGIMKTARRQRDGPSTGWGGVIADLRIGVRVAIERKTACQGKPQGGTRQVGVRPAR